MTQVHREQLLIDTRSNMTQVHKEQGMFTLTTPRSVTQVDKDLLLYGFINLENPSLRLFHTSCTCSWLQCVAVYCRVLQHAAMCCRPLPCTTACCSVSPNIAVCCSVVQCLVCVVRQHQVQQGRIALTCRTLVLGAPLRQDAQLKAHRVLQIHTVSTRLNTLPSHQPLQHTPAH